MSIRSEIQDQVLSKIDGRISPNKETVRAIEIAITLTAKQVLEEIETKAKASRCDCQNPDCECELNELIIAIEETKIKYEG